MKQYLYITLLLIYCWTGNAQNRVEAIGDWYWGGKKYTSCYEITNLKSANGRYSFESDQSYDYNDHIVTWIIKNLTTNSVIYRTKSFHFNNGVDPQIEFNLGFQFRLEPCNSNKCIINLHLDESTERRIMAVPNIIVYGVYCSKIDGYGNCRDHSTYYAGDLFGIESANIENKTTYNTNPELASTMVYQDRGDGVYTVPEYYQAKALLLTDEGDLQIVNTKEQVIWSLKQSQQDDKHFIAKGNTDPIQTASLVHTPEGHIELSNSKYQQEFDLNFLAKDYVLLSASNNKASELSVTSPNSMISMQVYQNSPTTSTAKSGLTSKSSTAKISPTESPKLLVIPDQKNGVRNIAKIETKKTAKTAKIVKIEKPMPTNTFTVFPNPVKDIINIVFDDTTETLTKLQILSLDGRIIREFTGSQTPNIQELSSGMYLYLIESTKNKYNGKIIKQ